MMQPVVHIVDDDAAVRDSLAFLLEANGIAAKTYESGAQLLEAIGSQPAGCVITDVRMPGMTGIELLARLKAADRDIAVIVITGHGDIPLAVEAMRAGAMDFIEKPFEDGTILRSVRAAVESCAGRSELAGERTAIQERLATLSSREREVFEAVVAGKANKIVAFDLGISVRTVEVYRANVMTKMQARGLSDLVRMALLVNPPRG